MGDIGPGQHEYEVEPLMVPAVPEPEVAPARVEPVRVPVGVPE